MTQAVCFKCGEIKFGAFCPCPQCRATPESDEDMAVSLVMTDHYFDADSLKQMGESVRRNGRPPDLDPQTRRNFLEAIRHGRDTIPGFGGNSKTARLAPATQKTSWWRFW